MADKLDALMTILFEYIDKETEKGEERIQNLFHLLLTIFDSAILTTHKSKYLFCTMYKCVHHSGTAKTRRHIGT